MLGKARLLLFGWLLGIFLLFLYSFTQIDLGLTLMRISFWQPIQRAFQSIGYFNRPLSALFYLLILVFLFCLYLLLLRAVKKQWFTDKQVWKLILTTALILWFSYNAFSYDIFNYIFDAKIIVHYQQNPYQTRPLDFSGDPMLGFMHWTHRPSVYPPLWIGLSVIPYFLGFGKFLLQFYAFKLTMVVSYLGTCSLIWRLSERYFPKQKILHLVFYAFNPLVLIESLVSAHNDGVMIFFGLLAVYLMLQKRLIGSYLSWLFSAGIKYVTVFLLPILLYLHRQNHQGKKIVVETVFMPLIVAMLFGLLAVVGKIEFQPWYLLWLIPFVAFKAENVFLFWLIIIWSFGSLWRYLPFLYYGNWDYPVSIYKQWSIFLPLVLGVVFGFLKKINFSLRKFLT